MDDVAWASIEIYCWLVLIESLTPILIEVLSTPTDVHKPQGCGVLSRLANLAFIVA